MEKSCDLLRASLRKRSKEIQLPIHNDNSGVPVEFFIAFDEAHDLVKRNKLAVHTRTAFSNLGTVLSWMTQFPLFVLFVSTNPSLGSFAPPPHLQESVRASAGSELLPPVTELPIDLFANGIADNNKLTLADSCQLDFVVKFGRPM